MSANTFTSKSNAQLATCHSALQDLFNSVLPYIDCTIIEGKRTEEQQRANVRRGVSKTMNSHHVYPLGEPSMAVDVAPYPIRWTDAPRFYYFAGFVKAMFIHLQLKGVIPNQYYLRWGGDWDGDNDFSDQTFNDLVHFELRKR